MSNALDKNSVKKIAGLARISADPSEEFLEKYSKELNSIVEYVGKLKELDTTGISATDGIRTITVNRLREDNPPQDAEQYRRIRQNIINNFPAKQGDLLIVPGVFE
jgi:aspartyl-tRNA(Asn)/glutamyl-tRNA(Gln) amidotransferase subunit C